MLSVNSGLVILLFAALLALNPFSMAALLAVVSGGFGSSHSVRRVRMLSAAFLSTLFALYAALGLIGAYILEGLDHSTLVATSLLASVVAIVWGVIELGSLFSGRLRVRIPADLATIIHRHTTKHVGLSDALMVGGYTAVASVFVAGPPLFALACLAVLFGGISNGAVLLCGIVLTAPLLVIAGIVLHSSSLSAISVWRQESTATLRAIIGLGAIVLGWLVLLVLAGVLEGGI